jgi:tyrosyl-tRNA synthetase
MKLSGQGEVNTDPAAVRDLIEKGVEDVFVKEDLERELLSGKKLRIKLGFDPTSTNIHIGRAITLRKLRDFQRMGHQAVFIVGDFTAVIGDASDKLDKRPMLTSEQVEKNLADYKEKVGKIVDIESAEFVRNSEWLSKLTFSDVATLAESFTVNQMLARRNFAERFEAGGEISLREFLYPIMQGYDSVMVKADVELGGFDQLFNLKAGRVMQKHHGMKEQNVITTTMLEGTDGRKMSGSWGNVINITDTPTDMFGKTMSVSDSLITKYMRLCTDMEAEKIAEVESALAGGSNPRDAKFELAKALVAQYHSKEEADAAHADFIAAFSDEGIPANIPEIFVEKGSTLMEALVFSAVVESKTEARRLFAAGAIKILEGDTLTKTTDPDGSVVDGMVVKVGKHRFATLRLK